MKVIPVLVCIRVYVLGNVFRNSFSKLIIIVIERNSILLILCTRYCNKAYVAKELTAAIYATKFIYSAKNNILQVFTKLSITDWSLQSFTQDYNLASNNTPALPTVYWVRTTDFWEIFHGNLIYFQCFWQKLHKGKHWSWHQGQLDFTTTGHFLPKRGCQNCTAA